MKKFLTALLLFATSAACLALCACDSKNAQVSFETDGGVEISAVSVEKGSEYELPVPVKEGYEFDGWYESEALTGNAVTSVKVEGDVKYYAKWRKLHTVTLNTDGGSLASTSLKLKDGANLYEAVKDCVPVKADYSFDAWMNGEAALTPGFKITQDLTLKARYKVKYTVEVYRESLDGSAYVKDDEAVVGYGYVGETVIPNVSSDETVGFTAVQHEGEVISLSLDASAAKNVFKFYYDRESYTVSFRSNYPDGTGAEIKSERVRYGNEVELPADVTFDGYCLAGWATSASGEVAYRVDSVAGALYGGDGAGEGVKITPDKDTALYAVWVKGYTDMFGGGDVVYLFDENGDEIYLSRGGVFFKGEYYGVPSAAAGKSYGEFSIRDGNARVYGRIYPDCTFSYYNPDNDMKPLTLYRYGEGLVEGTTVILDGYNGITYRVSGEGALSSKGTYSISEDGLYIAEFGEGELDGQTLALLVSKITINNTSYDVFLVKDEQLYGSDIMRCATISNTGDLTYYTTYHTLIFTGFGNAYCYEGSSYSSYYCRFEDDKLILTKSTTGSTPTEAKLLKINGESCYLLYEPKYNFTAVSGDDSIALDGYGNAVYTRGGSKMTGTYSVKSASFAKYEVTFYYNGAVAGLFLVDSREVGGGDTPVTVAYSYTEKPVDYAVYSYADVNGIYSKIYVVLNDTLAAGEAKNAAVYTKLDSGLVKISDGTYEYKDGVYVYTVASYKMPEDAVSPFGEDIPDTIVFTIGTATMLGISLPTIYGLEYTCGETTTNYATVYTAANGATLSLAVYGSIGSVAIYKTNDGNVYMGSFSESSNIVTLSGNGGELYFELNKSAGSFETLLFPPYRIYALTEKLSTDRNAYILFSGKGSVESLKAAYYVKVDDAFTSVEGAVTENDDGTYTFTSDDGGTVVKYKLFTSSSSSAFAVYSDTYAGRYISEEGTLELDGYGYNAELSTKAGILRTVYMVEAENVIVFSGDGRTYYADLVKDGAGTLNNRGSFTIRGKEFGTYFVDDNNYINGIMLSLDGYGKLQVFELADDGNGGYEQKFIDENGTYDVTGDVITVHYDGKNVAGVASYRSYNGSTIALFTIIKSEVAKTYVSTTDWAVLILDGAGNAVKYSGENGTKEKGSYTIVTENLLYYYNEEGVDACVYEYDAETRVATARNYTARGYYTETLESLVFTRYGYAVFNGETRYYYFIEEDDNVSVYRRPKDNETGANKYGFVKENFGKFDDTKTYDGKVYNLSDGFAITFNRTAANAEKFPVPFQGGEKHPLGALSFTPAGSSEFRVAGTVIINDQKFNCNIIRRTVNGVLETFIAVPISSSNTSNYFRFDIDITYGGVSQDGSSNSVYTVKGMQLIRDYESYVFLYNYYMYNYFASMMGYEYGISMENTLGQIMIITEYDESGEGGDTYVNTNFGPSTALYDVNGEIISPQHLEYTYDEAQGLYSCEFTHTDGYVYRMRFATQYLNQFSCYGYILHSVVRVQNMTAGEYAAEVETLIASDYFSNLGAVFSVKLMKNGEEIEFTTGISMDDGLYYISRTKDGESGLITASKYFRIVLTQATVADEENKSVPVYTEMTVKELAVVTVYAADGKSYADICKAEGRVMYFYLYNEETKSGANYVPVSCEYSAENDEYLATLSSGRVFSVKIETEDGKDTAVIAEVVEEEEAA